MSIETEEGAGNIVGDLGDLPELTAEELEALEQQSDDDGEELDDGNPDGDEGEGAEGADGDGSDDAGDGDEGDGDEGEEGDGGENTYQPGATLRQFAEANNVPFNEDQIPEDFTVDQEMDLLNKLNQQLLAKTKAAVEDANTLAQIYKEDQEVLDFLEARKQGKTLKDYVKEIADAPAYADADALVLKYYKEENGFTEDEALDELQALKDKEKFNTKHQTVQKFYEQKAALAAEQAAEQERYEMEQQEQMRQQAIQSYQQYVAKQSKLGDFVLDDQIKQDLYEYATQPGQNQLTQLEQDLQSDENVLRASIALKYWDSIVSTLKNSSSSKAQLDLLGKLTTDDPSKLQRGSRGSKSKTQFDLEALDSF